MINNTKTFYEHESLFSLFNSLSRETGHSLNSFIVKTVHNRAHCLMFSYPHIMFLSIQYINKNIILNFLFMDISNTKLTKTANIDLYSIASYLRQSSNQISTNQLHPKG